jgi:transcriptional regulator with XRE-family HTH domain
VARWDASPEWRQRVGERLAEARRRKRLKLREVEDETGLSVAAVSSAEHGRHALSLAVALRLAICYGVSLDWVAGRGEG